MSRFMANLAFTVALMGGDDFRKLAPSFALKRGYVETLDCTVV